VKSCGAECARAAQASACTVADRWPLTDLEQALAAARAQHGRNKSRANGDVGASRRGPGDRAEDIQVIFEEPFTSRGGRKGSSPLVCMGSGEHTVYVLQVCYPRMRVEARVAKMIRACVRSGCPVQNTRFVHACRHVWIHAA